MIRDPFSWPNFLIRWAAALVLVFATFNPTSYSYYAWATDFGGGLVPLKVFAGIVIVIAYVIFMRATWRSIGPIGLVLSVGFFAALVWVLIDFGLLAPGHGQQMTYALLVVMATVLAIGVSWSHVRRRVSGQMDTDEIE